MSLFTQAHARAHTHTRTRAEEHTETDLWREVPDKDSSDCLKFGAVMKQCAGGRHDWQVFFRSSSSLCLPPPKCTNAMCVIKGVVVWCAVVCRGVPCRAVVCRAVVCRAVVWQAWCGVPWRGVAWRGPPWPWAWPPTPPGPCSWKILISL